MPLTDGQIRTHLKAFEFTPLFNGLGWNRPKGKDEAVAVGEETALLRRVAEKMGMQVFVCAPDGAGRIPDYQTRRKIDRAVTKGIAYEHFIIFVDAAETAQVWQWVKREPGRPNACREIAYSIAQQDPLLLIQTLQGITFTLAEEEALTTVQTTGRVRQAFDVETVTKKFYDRFKSEHGAFLGTIEGIPDLDTREWYASLMLNRLMFVSFIQSRGFLDNDREYLVNRLARSKEQLGDDQFHRFYREFLLRLFHDGLSGKPPRPPAIAALLGDVPYLNGGLFEEHQIEREYAIAIPDSAFARVFAFFGEYQWHLDTRLTRQGNEINPDVLGYIFEKYINQKEMGAYYTKEDITEYIGKNTIIPFLFDAVREGNKDAFAPDGALWQSVRNDPDRYLYPAVRKGVDLKVPDEIAAGKDDVAQRGGWNKPAAPEHALPTETWREYMARRDRYEDVWLKIYNGEVTAINDFITYNLDIRQLAQDVIETCEEPGLLRAFWKAITTVKVLDPTCGSGAFLFAALNILAPLYDACLERMQTFVTAQDSLLTAHTRGQFEAILRAVAERPSRPYYIAKEIILNNLYGVDIMEEAVEICKLRLFLKLAAHLGDDRAIEPLPDIDFNIRAGNTLVGFASLADVRGVVMRRLGGEQVMAQIAERAEIVDRAYQQFHRQQNDLGGTVTAADKATLRDRLRGLGAELDIYLAAEYGIVESDKKDDYTEKLDTWRKSHQPFHWFSEFYGIMANGGFDVIIGNPPYVEYKDVKEYRVVNYKSEDSGDLYAFTLERAYDLSITGSRVGFIVPMSCFAVDGFKSLQQLYFSTTSPLYISNWSGDAHPSKLFEGVDKRLEIIIGRHVEAINEPDLATSKYLKWYAEERNNLFALNPTYQRITDLSTTAVFPTSVPKVESPLSLSILKKLRSRKRRVEHIARSNGKWIMYYTRKVSFFLQFLEFIPEVRDSKGELREPSELKILHFDSEKDRDLCLAALSSSLFYWYYIANSDCRNLNKREIMSFPLPDMIPDTAHAEIRRKLALLMESYKKNSSLRTVNYAKLGNITVQYFNFRPSKPIIDEIDRVLAAHYGFTEEELDFIINYDIKYRMGAEAEGGGA